MWIRGKRTWANENVYEMVLVLGGKDPSPEARNPS